MGAYKRDVVVVIKMGAYIHGILFCVSAYYPDFTVVLYTYVRYECRFIQLYRNCLIYRVCWPSVNPLTMSDDYSHHRNSAACYQLAQSVLIGSALAERVGQEEVGGCTSPSG